MQCSASTMGGGEVMLVSLSLSLGSAWAIASCSSTGSSLFDVQHLSSIVGPENQIAARSVMSRRA